MYNNYKDPHSISDRFEDVYVYHNHVSPAQNRGAEFPSQLIYLQSKTVELHNGLNTRFGEELKQCLLFKPVVYSPYARGNIQSPITDSKSNKRTATHNTGVRPLKRNETFIVVPPMCDCSDRYKIQGVIPLQTVSHIKYSAALNQFFDWIKGVTFLKSLIGDNSKVFSLALSMAYEQIKGNYLVQDMMKYITVPDGAQMTKVQTLYDIVIEHWMKPLFGHVGITSHNADIPTTILTSLRAINDTDPEYKALFRLADIDSLNDELREMFTAKLKVKVATALKIIKYYTMLAQYMLPLEMKAAGTICVSYDDQFFVYPGKKMEVKQF